MYIYLWACANLQWRSGLNSNHCPRRKGYKCSVPLNAFMTVLCTEFGIILIVNGPYISPRLDEGLIRDGWVPKIDSSFTIFFIYPTSPQWAGASLFTRFLDHTQRRTTVGRAPLDEWSPRQRDLYLTSHKTHNRHPYVRRNSNPTIPARERPQTHALDRAATGTGFTTIGL